MAECDVCGQQIDMPYECRRCGSEFCAEHRLPENHSCPGLNEWNDPEGVFESDIDQKRSGTTDSGLFDSLSARGGPLSYFRKNVSYLFLGIMVLVFALQYIVYPVLGFRAPGSAGPFDPGHPLWRATFVLRPEHPEYVWTWVTSIFSHGGFTHLFGNGIALFFFGPIVERYIGSKRFVALFLTAGVLASLGQIGLGLFSSDPAGVLGASGAIMAVMALLTVLNPDIKVLLFFFIPMPIWGLTLGYALISVFGAFGTIGGGIAHMAHLLGLVIGFAYGKRIEDEVSLPNQFQFGGGGGGMGGMGGGGGRRRF
ncbi:rhomboid family intramembrane serine protease [Halobacteriales archaeon SW_8_65_20]|nr:MAG: rhomboid family intramembrane serine protease [Halobacteriales archaeon SW_8_65_20]